MIEVALAQVYRTRYRNSLKQKSRCIEGEKISVKAWGSVAAVVIAAVVVLTYVQTGSVIRLYHNLPRSVGGMQEYQTQVSVKNSGGRYGEFELQLLSSDFQLSNFNPDPGNGTETIPTWTYPVMPAETIPIRFTLEMGEMPGVIPENTIYEIKFKFNGTEYTFQYIMGAQYYFEPLNF